jgi:hypothetical protein
VESAATMKFKQDQQVLTAVDKVMSQTIEAGGFRDAKGNMLGGADLSKAVMDQIAKNYMKDKSVAPYLPQIREWLARVSRTETFNDPKAFLRLITDQQTTTQQGLQNSQLNDRLTGVEQKLGALPSELQQDAGDLFGGGGQQQDIYQ